MTSETAESIIARFLDYLVVNCGQENAARRVGAARQDIDRLLELMRLPVPASYLGYLLEFGESDNFLKMAGDGNTNVKQLINYYSGHVKVIEEGWPDNITPGVVFISTPGLTGGRGLYHSTNSTATEPTVAVTEGLAINHVTASSFEKYLYRQAFTRKLSINPRATSIARRYRTELIPELTAMVQREGFEVSWFSDNYQLCCTRMERHLLALYQGSSTVVYFYGQDREDSERLRVYFSDALSLKNTTPR